MEKNKLNDRIKREFSMDIQRKLNRGMKILLTISDEEIITEIERDRKKIEGKKKEIDKRVQEILSSDESSNHDVNIRERIKELRLQKKSLLPHPVLSAVLRPLILPIRIKAIVRFTGNRNDLVDLGIEVRSQAQDVFTIIGTRTSLKELAQQPACRRLRTPRIMMSIVEQASEQAEVEAVHDPRPANPTGYQGNGVLVGIIDSVLDITHHGFRDPAGTHDTRVLYYWVQSPHTRDMWGNPVPQNPPGQTPQQFYNANPATRPIFTGFNYGRLYTDADINTALAQANPYGTGRARSQAMFNSFWVPYYKMFKIFF